MPGLKLSSASCESLKLTRRLHTGKECWEQQQPAARSVLRACPCILGVLSVSVAVLFYCYFTAVFLLFCCYWCYVSIFNHHY